MGEQSEDERKAGLPKRGDLFVCEKCDHAIVVTVDCDCGCDDEEQPHYRCCDAEMVKMP